MSIEFGLISVIMAAYNAEKTIGLAIESVLNQTYKNLELIVVNDCSTDNTVDEIKKIAETDRRVRLIENETNSGVSYTRKRALEEAKGDWIAILDSDDMWMEDKLEKQIKLHYEMGGELLFTGSAFIDADGNYIDWYLHAPKEIEYKQLLKQNLVSNSSVLVKKWLYVEFYANGDEMHEDFATWLRILKTGRRAYGVDEPLLVYRLGENSKSGNKFKAAKMNWNTYRYIGLGLISTMYYMVWYTINGVLKYRNLK